MHWDFNLQIIFNTNHEFCPTKLVLCFACGRIQKGFQMDPQNSEFGKRSKSREGKIRVSEFRDLDPPGKVILRLLHKHASKSDPIWDFNLQIQTGQVTLKTLYENVFRGVTPYQSKAGKTSLVLHTNTSYLMFLS